MTTLSELGSTFATGLEFLGGPDKSLDFVIKKYDGEEVTVKAAVPAREADPEKGIEAAPAQPEVKVKVTAKERNKVMGAIASLSNLRPQFAKMVADKVAEFRDKSEDHDALIQQLETAREQVEKIEGQIKALDQQAVEGFELDNFVIWSPDEVTVRTFAGNVSRGGGAGRRRAAATAKWSLAQYNCSQRRVGDYGDVVLRKENGSWSVYSGLTPLVSNAASPNAAMQELLELCGMKPTRSAPVFWAAPLQEDGGDPWAE